MEDPSNNSAGFNIFLICIRFILNYLKYCFLTGSVIFSILILLFIILNINPQFSFSFLRLFAFLNPSYATGSYTIGLKEIVRLFFVVSLAFTFLLLLIKMVLKKVFKVNPELKTRTKIILFSSIITLAYVIAIFFVCLTSKVDKNILIVFVCFYLMNVFSAAAYFIVDNFQRKLFSLLMPSPKR